MLASRDSAAARAVLAEASLPIPAVPGRLWRWVDRFLAPQSARLKPDELRRARLAVVLCGSVALLATVATTNLLLHGVWGNLPIGFGILVMALSVPFALRSTGSVTLAGNLIAGMMAVALSALKFTTGAIAVPPFIFQPAVPLLAALIAGPRSGVVWAGIALAELAFFYSLAVNGLEPSIALDPGHLFRGRYVGSAIMVVFVLLLVKSYERLKNRALEELSQAEARIRAILENSVDAIITIDTRGIVHAYNKSSETIFGYAAEEVIGNNVKMLMPSPTREEHDGYIERFLRTGEAGIVGVGREVIGARRDGATVPLYLSISHVELDGEIFFTGILHDISAQKQAEASLFHANKALEAANLELDSFVYSASHDIRAPLRSVLGLIGRSEKALARGEHAKLSEQYLPLVVKNIEKLDRLVLDLLAISHADRAEHTVSEVDFEHVVEECLQQLAQMDGADEMRFSTHVNVAGAYRCELPRLQQLLSNLLSNSIKYRDPSKAICTLDVSAEALAGQPITITVQDNGTGIREKEHGQAFKMFSRATSTSFGAGLGLYLVKKQVEKLHGTIDYTTSPAGTEFTIELPRPAGEEGEDGTA